MTTPETFRKVFLCCAHCDVTSKLHKLGHVSPCYRPGCLEGKATGLIGMTNLNGTDTKD